MVLFSIQGSKIENKQTDLLLNACFFLQSTMPLKIHSKYYQKEKAFVGLCQKCNKIFEIWGDQFQMKNVKKLGIFVLNVIYIFNA